MQARSLQPGRRRERRTRARSAAADSATNIFGDNPLQVCVCTRARVGCQRSDAYTICIHICIHISRQNTQRIHNMHTKEKTKHTQGYRAQSMTERLQAPGAHSARTQVACPALTDILKIQRLCVCT